jgi:hypothetical protein
MFGARRSASRARSGRLPPASSLTEPQRSVSESSRLGEPSGEARLPDSETFRAARRRRVGGSVWESSRLGEPSGEAHLPDSETFRAARRRRVVAEASGSRTQLSHKVGDGRF